MDDTERLEAIRSDFTFDELATAYLATLTRLEEAEIRNLQYDNIVRGVCNDLGIDEGAGCDEIAMASANARSLRDRMIEVVEQKQRAFVKYRQHQKALACGEVLTALKEIDKEKL